MSVAVVSAAVLAFDLLLLMRRRGPRSPLFPYTTLFRSLDEGRLVVQDSFDLQGRPGPARGTEFTGGRSEEHTSEPQSHHDIVCRLLLAKKKAAAATA